MTHREASSQIATNELISQHGSRNERRHVIELLRLHPELQGRVHLLAMLAGERWGSVDIPDPHGGSADDHRRCFERIAHLLRLAIAGPGTPSRRGRMASASR